MELSLIAFAAAIAGSASAKGNCPYGIPWICQLPT